MAFVKTKKRKGKKFLYIGENYTDKHGIRRQRLIGEPLGELGKDITRVQANHIRDQYNAKPNQFTHDFKTLEEVEVEFRASYLLKVGKTVKKRTFKRYTDDMPRLQELMQMKIQKVDTDCIEGQMARLTDRDMGNRTVNLAMMSLKKILKFAFRKKYILTMPEIPKLPEKRHNIDAHTTEEIKILLKAAESTPNLYKYCRLILETGMRPEEARQLEPERLNVSESYIAIISDRLNKRGRNIPLRQSFAEELATWENLCPYKTIDGVNTMFSRLSKKVGFRCYPKKLRATFASLMVQADINPFHLAEIMGTSVGVLQRYYVAHRHEKLRVEMDKNPFFNIYEEQMRNRDYEGKLLKLAI